MRNSTQQHKRDVLIGIDVCVFVTGVILLIVLMKMRHPIPGLWFIGTCCTVLLTAFAGFALERHWGPRQLKTWIAVIFIAGSLLRIVYMLQTPYSVREYDTLGHLEYVRYMTNTWSVPQADKGWEFHQGPLFYVGGAVVMTADKWLGNTYTTAIEDIRSYSLLLSIATLAVCAWMAFLLFGERQRMQAAIFLAIPAAFPSLVFLSGRISNEALSHLLAFLFCAALLLWWKTARPRDWYAACVLLGLGMLTRWSSLALVPALLLCLLMRDGIPARKKIRLVLGFTLITLCMAGWLAALRYQQHDFHRLLLPSNGDDPRLRMVASLQHFATFNPLRLLRNPFVNLFPSMWDPQFFLEYFTRSSLFGFWNFYRLLELAKLLMLTLFCTMGLAAFGLLKGWREPFAKPMTVIGITLFLAAAVYNGLHPTTSTQDFRFSLPLILPLAFFAVTGARLLPGRAKALGAAALIAFACSAATLVVLVPPMG